MSFVRNESKALTRISLPLALAQLFQVSIGAIDTYFLSKLGYAQLGGAALAIQAFTLTSVFMGGLLSMIGVQKAFYNGQGDTNKANQVISNGLCLALLLSSLFGLFLSLFPSLLILLQQPPEAIAYAELYTFPLIFCTLPNLVWVSMRYFYSAEMRTSYLIWTNLAGLIVKYIGNVTLSPIFGIEGIAWTTVGAYWLMAILAYAFAYPLQLSIPRWEGIRNLLRLGLPVSFSAVSDTGFFAFLTLLAGSLGVASLAAHYQAFQFLFLPYIFPYSVNIASSVRVAHYFGKEEKYLIPQVIKIGLIVGLIPILLISCFYFLFQSSQYPLLWLVGIFQIFNAIQSILMGSLRGMKDTKIPFVINFFSYWLFGIPLCIYLSNLMDLKGIWIGMILTQCLLTLLLKIRLDRNELERTASVT